MKRLIALAFSFVALAFAAPASADDLTDILNAAENDNVQAQLTLGGMHEHGMGVALNDRRSAYWWQRALDNGHYGIAKGLGSMHFSGRGVPLNYERAMELYMIAAEKVNHPHAIKYIALGYKRGLGLPQDDAKAQEWAERAAKLEGADSAVVFLDSLESEETEVHTEEEIFKEFEAQEKKGNPRANYYLSVAYSSGTGVMRDYKEAEKWARKAAEAKLTSGTSYLGLMNQLGQGMDVNRVEAQKWHYVTEALRPSEEPFLSTVNGNYMSDGEKAEAREEADKWIDANIVKNPGAS
jgi:TPR repeat protein